MSTDKKYGLQDLYRDPSEEEDEEQDSDFVPEGLVPRMYL
jgi:hypothetical protein